MAAKRTCQLTEQQIEALKTAFKKCPEGAMRTRLQAVRLYGNGYTVAEIMELTGCSRRSLLRWSEQYRSDGIDGLIDQRQGGNRAMLNEAQLADVERKLRQYRPVDVLGSTNVATTNGHYWTVPDLKLALQQWYGIVYQSNSAYRKLFHRCGFSYQRPGKVFRSRSAQKVADFAEQLEKK
jgi:transposase